MVFSSNSVCLMVGHVRARIYHDFARQVASPIMQICGGHAQVLQNSFPCKCECQKNGLENNMWGTTFALNENCSVNIFPQFLGRPQEQFHEQVFYSDCKAFKHDNGCLTPHITIPALLPISLLWRGSRCAPDTAGERLLVMSQTCG